MRRISLIIAVPLLALNGCRSESTAPGVQGENTGPEGAVRATRVAGGIEVHNATPNAVAYFAYNRSLLALWATCVDPGPDCVRLPAGTTAIVPDSAIAGYAVGVREAAVYFYRVVPDDAGGHRQEPIREVIVRIR